jgi:hypothetical protein
MIEITDPPKILKAVPLGQKDIQIHLQPPLRDGGHQ